MSDLERLAHGLADGTWTDTYKELQIIHAAHERIDELELREEAMRWVIWQECELAESKIARGCRWFDIEYIKHGFPKLMPEEQDNE